MVLIRSLTKSQMGSYSLFLVVTSIFEITKGGLLKNAHIRFVSSLPEGDQEKSIVASSSLLINAFVSFLFIVFILLGSKLLGSWFHAEKDFEQMLTWFIPGLIFMVLFSHLEAIQQSHLDFKGVFAGYFIRQTTFFLFISIHAISKAPFSLKYVALYQSISIAVGTFVIYMYSRKYIYGRFDPSRAWIKRILGYGGYIFGSGIMGNIFANVDQIMIATFMTSSSVSYYGAAFRINQIIDIPSYAASEILFPIISRAATEEGTHKIKYLYEKMVSTLLSFTIPTAIFIMIFPKIVISLIAGSKYQAAAPILQLYMITGILRPMQNQAANLLNSIGKSGLCFVMNTLSLLINLIINYLCLLKIGFYGAAIGTMITCILGSVAWYIMMHKLVGINLKNILKYMVEFYEKLPRLLRNVIPKTKPAGEN